MTHGIWSLKRWWQDRWAGSTGKGTCLPTWVQFLEATWVGGAVIPAGCALTSTGVHGMQMPTRTQTAHVRVCIWRPKKSNKAEALCQPFQKIREHARFSTQMQLVYFDLSSSKLLTPQLKYAVCSNKYQAVVMTDQPICASRMYNFCL